MAEKKSPPPPDVESLSWIGHGLAGLLGILSLVAAFFAWRDSMQVTLVLSLLVIGALLPTLSFLSFTKTNRAAWAFLVALSIVLGIMTLFGAPKVRNLVDIPLAAALVIPGLLAVAGFCLSSLGHRYKS